MRTALSKSTNTRRFRLALTLAAGTAAAHAQTSPAEPPAAQAPAAATAAATGGTIHGTVKAGAIPLPGVAVTATNTLTGKKYATTTDVDGNYAMTIPRTGRYVVKAELAAFATVTNEVRITAEAADQTSAFTLELASRAAQTAAASGGDTTGIAAIASALGRGTQSLSVTGDSSLEGASSGTANAGAALPSLANLGDSSATATDSVAVSGVQGQTNALAGFSEDQIRERVEDAMNQSRQNGGATGDQVNAVVSLLGGMLGGGGPGGGGPGGGGGGRGGRGGGGGGGGAFRNFNPAQPHGAIFYQGGNSALNSSSWQATSAGNAHFRANPSAYSNRFGLSIASSPYIPGLTKPDTRQFAFINITGQKNLNAFYQSGRVPTDAEKNGDFSNSQQLVNGNLQHVTIYQPGTNIPYAGNMIPATARAAQAVALLQFYPEPNLVTTDPTGYNFQTVSNYGTNNIAINTRYNRSLGPQSSSPFARFAQGGGGAGQGGGRRGGGQNANQPPVLRQSINASYNYSHNAQDIRNIFLALGGATVTDGNAVNVGYTISYGRLSNNASLSWNRSSGMTRNYFTDTANNPTAAAGISVPNRTGSIVDQRFYNGVPTIGVTNFTGLSNTTPSQTINQTISFSDFVSYRHKKHNYRFGFDVRRVHADSVGGNNPLGNLQFSGYATESPADQTATALGTQDQAATGAGFADFLLGLPTQTSLQAGLNKIYLRDNVYDAYAQDDFRMLPNFTLNYGLRYEYFAPYTEKNNRLVNLDHNADFTIVTPVFPNTTSQFTGDYGRSLVNPDYTMFAPRFGFAWSPKYKWTKNTVVRGGYGTNYNTGQFGSFAKSLAFQPPFAATQTNAVRTVATVGTNNCTTISQSTGTPTATLTLANGFGCATTGTVQNNFSVNKDYRLGMVQVYNLNIQRTLPQGLVLNVGYNGAKGSNLDIVRAPNHTATTVTTPNASAFRYEDSIAGSHSNQLLVSLQQRQHKGIALGATYTYSHSIDNASSIGGGSSTTAQNDKRLDLEEANSSFDQRHLLTANFLLELPFGPNRAFLNKGGILAHILDNFSLSGNSSFGSGSYYTPQYSSSAAQELAGGTYTLRPDRVFTQSLKGPGTLAQFFNKAAFVKPANGFGTASRNSIEGPGTISTNASLSRTVPLGDTRSFEARVTANNVFNTVQYNGINTIVNNANYGQVTGAASMRTLQVQARYRF